MAKCFAKIAKMKIQIKTKVLNIKMFINKVFKTEKYYFIVYDDEFVKKYKSLKTLIMCMASLQGLSYKEASPKIMEAYYKEEGIKIEKISRINKRTLKKIPMKTKEDLIREELKTYLSIKKKKYIEMPTERIGYLLTFEALNDLRFRDQMTIKNYMEVLLKGRDNVRNNQCIETFLNTIGVEAEPVRGLTIYDYSPCKLFLFHLFNVLQ